jgi:hypothetical protein
MLSRKRRFSTVERELTVRQKMGRMFWYLVTEVMVKILWQCFSTRRCIRKIKSIGGRVERNNWRGMMAWIQEDTERDYSQREYGKSILVLGDGGDGENSPAMLIQGDDVPFTDGEACSGHQHYRTSRTVPARGPFAFFLLLPDFVRRSGKLVREVREITALPDPGPGPLKRPVLQSTVKSA